MAESPPEFDDGSDLLSRVLVALGHPPAGELRVFRKHGRILCALPSSGKLAGLTLGLYAPQRKSARLAAAGLRLALGVAPLRQLLGRAYRPPEMDGTSRQTGVLLGTAGHAVERAVAVYQVGESIEVAKLAFGSTGREVLSREAAILEQVGPHDCGAPDLLGLTASDEVTILRMPWDAGRPFRARGLAPVLPLLVSWLSDAPPRALRTFDEWGRIEDGLRQAGVGEDRIAALAEHPVRPAIRHGDFTRWNLREDSGQGLRVHDWERGTMAGPAGFDLVHYLAQDGLLVRRLPPETLVAEVRADLDHAAADYLRSAGWQGKVDDLMLAVFAFTTAAGYEDQSELIRTMEGSR